MSGNLFADPDLCNRCGQCCHVPSPHGALLTVVCRHLEVDGSHTKCGVWENRHEVSFCTSAQHKAEVCQLPKSCPYVKDDPTYTANYTYANAFIEGVIVSQTRPSPHIKRWTGPNGLDLCPP